MRIFGAAELAGLGVFYVKKWRADYVAAHPQAVATPAPVAPVVAEKTTPPSATTTTAATTTTQSTPSAAALSTAEQMLKEAADLRDKGDTTNALARLQDAAQRDPKNASALAEMAMIYESIQLTERSNETWRKIMEIGPSAGPLYELADMKLKTGTFRQPRPPPPRLRPRRPVRVSPALLRSMPGQPATTRKAFPTVRPLALPK